MHRAGREGWGKTGIAVAEGSGQTNRSTGEREGVEINDVGVGTQIKANRAVARQCVHGNAVTAVANPRQP